MPNCRQSLFCAVFNEHHSHHFNKPCSFALHCIMLSGILYDLTNISKRTNIRRLSIIFSSIMSWNVLVITHWPILKICWIQVILGDTRWDGLFVDSLHTLKQGLYLIWGIQMHNEIKIQGGLGLQCLRFYLSKSYESRPSYSSEILHLYYTLHTFLTFCLQIKPQHLKITIKTSLLTTHFWCTDYAPANIWQAKQIVG